MISIRWKSRADEIDPQLWAECFPPPLEGKWWYTTLERAGLEDQFTFLYALIESDGHPIAIAPAFLSNVPIDLVAPPLIAKLLRAGGAILPRLRYQRTLFIGSPCSDEGSIGLTPGVNLQQVIESLQPELESVARREKASIIVYKDFSEDSAPAFAPMLDSRYLFSVPSYPGTRVPLPPGGFDAYLKSLKGSHRHNLKKKLRKSRDRGDLDSSVIQSPSPEVLKEIFALFWQTYEHGTTKFERLTPAFFSIIAKEPTSHFIVLRDPKTAKLVAFMLCFALGPRAINKFIGLDYVYSNDWYLYFRLWESAVQWALTTSATELQSGQTGYRAKSDVGHSLVPLTNYCRHRNPLLHKLFARIAKTITWSTLDEDLATLLKAHPEPH